MRGPGHALDVEALVRDLEQERTAAAGEREQLALERTEVAQERRELDKEKRQVDQERARVLSEARAPVKVLGHALALNRTKFHGRTTSWLSGCRCGWKAEHRVDSRLEAKAQYREHVLDTGGARLGTVVGRDYSTLGPGVTAEAACGLHQAGLCDCPPEE